MKVKNDHLVFVSLDIYLFVCMYMKSFFEFLLNLNTILNSFDSISCIFILSFLTSPDVFESVDEYMSAHNVVPWM